MQTLQNGIVVPTNSDPYQLTTDLAGMGAAANVIIPVATQAARDALTNKFVGMTVRRTDLGGALQWWSGSAWTGTRHAEFTTPANPVPTGVAWGLGVFTMDSSKTDDTGFVTIQATDQLKVRDAGIYSITVTVTFSAAISGVSWMGVESSFVVPMGGGLMVAGASIPNLKLAANAIIAPSLSHGSGSDRSFTSRVRVTRVA